MDSLVKLVNSATHSPIAGAEIDHIKRNDKKGV